MQDNQQILELLTKIEKTNRRQLLFTQILCGAALAAAVFCIVTLVRLGALLPQLEITVSQMQGVLQSLDSVAAELAELDMKSIVDNVNALAISAQDSLRQTMTKLDTINFETLNQAIEDLAAVVEPLAKFFNVFHKAG